MFATSSTDGEDEKQFKLCFSFYIKFQSLKYNKKAQIIGLLLDFYFTLYLWYTFDFLFIFVFNIYTIYFHLLKSYYERGCFIY
jgi:hypothetical protein